MLFFVRLSELCVALSVCSSSSNRLFSRIGQQNEICAVIGAIRYYITLWYLCMCSCCINRERTLRKQKKVSVFNNWTFLDVRKGGPMNSCLSICLSDWPVIFLHTHRNRVTEKRDWSGFSRKILVYIKLAQSKVSLSFLKILSLLLLEIILKKSAYNSLLPCLPSSKLLTKMFSSNQVAGFFDHQYLNSWMS